MRKIVDFVYKKLYNVKISFLLKINKRDIFPIRYTFDFICKIIENIKTSRKLTRLDSKYLPSGYQQILCSNIKV